MTEDDGPKIAVAERVEIEFDVPRGSVPAVRQSAIFAVETIKSSSRLTAVGNVLFSLISIIAAHPIAAVHAFAAVVVFTSQVLTMNPQGGGAAASGAQEFQPLHHYFVSTTGNDANDGLGPSNAHAWASLNHNTIVCGDLIEVVPATNWNGDSLSSVFDATSCPSASGGIDGTGGIYFAAVVCGGSDLEACVVTSGTHGGLVTAFNNNWAYIGLKCNGGGSAGARCFEAWACDAPHHHVAFINDESINALQGYDTNDCGGTIAMNSGSDYFAVVGSIAQNSAQDSTCLAAVDVVGPGVWDTAPGPHFILLGNASYANANIAGGCRARSDIEAFMFDTWDFHNVNSKGVIANNIGYSSDRMCIQLFWQNNAVNTPTINVYNNTCFRNNLNTGGDNLDAEINLNGNGGAHTFPWIMSIHDNIAYQPLSASTSGGGNVAAFANYGLASALTNGTAGHENIYRANNGSCAFAFCDGTFSAESQGAAGDLGTNTYTDPLFANTTDLLANQVGAPTCTGKQTVTQCMGYDPNTRVLTSPSIIADLQASCVGCAGKGYQFPSTTCLSSFPDYPTWLKGMNRLGKNQVDGKFYTFSDLATKLCGT